MDEFNGIILYNIQLDGNISGVYTNMPAGGRIYLEILTRMPPVNRIANVDIVGTYQSMYFQGTERICDAVCKITRRDNSDIFTFIWTRGNNPIFEGIGYIMNQTQIVVHYRTIEN